MTGSVLSVSTHNFKLKSDTKVFAPASYSKGSVNTSAHTIMKPSKVWPY